MADGHHSLSHHQNNDGKIAKIKKIDRHHIEQYAYLLERLKAIPDDQGTLLDNCMIVYGSGISDANRHKHHDLPVIVAGKGGGTLETGRHVRFAEETPMANLFVALLDRFGTPTDKFGDSTGSLDSLS